MYDLNFKLRSVKDKEKEQIIKRYYELGWNCIAFTTSVIGKIEGHQSNYKPIKPTITNVQTRDSNLLRSLATSKSSASEVRQMSRISITIDDMADAQSLTTGNEFLRNFDIVSVCPGNPKIFSYLCKTADIDIITLDFTRKISFSINKKLIDEAVLRGIFFEIIYSPIITNAHARREIINGTSILVQYLRGRNFIISSGAETFTQLRGPMDVSYIGQSLNIHKELAMKAISENGALVIKHATTRKLRYLPIEIVTKNEFLLKYPEFSLQLSQSSILSKISSETKSQRLNEPESDLLYDENSNIPYDNNNNNVTNDDFVPLNSNSNIDVDLLNHDDSSDEEAKSDSSDDSPARHRAAAQPSFNSKKKDRNELNTLKRKFHFNKKL